MTDRLFLCDQILCEFHLIWPHSLFKSRLCHGQAQLQHILFEQRIRRGKRVIRRTTRRSSGKAVMMTHVLFETVLTHVLLEAVMMTHVLFEAVVTHVLLEAVLARRQRRGSGDIQERRRTQRHRHLSVEPVCFVQIPPDLGSFSYSYLIAHRI